MMTKPRVVKDYDKLSEAVVAKIKKAYPMGYEKHLVKFKNKAGIMVSSLPFEMEDKYYLIRMTAVQATGSSDEEIEEPDYDAIIASSDSSKDEFEMDMEREEEE